MTRKSCNQCKYPTATCICESVHNCSAPINIVILQHPTESKHAKNTARIAKLVTPEINLINLQNIDKLQEIKNDLLAESTILLYPSDKSESLEDLNSSIWANEGGVQNAPCRIKTLVFLDASWKQAYAIWQNNQWLHQYKQCHFSSSFPQNYHIRKSKKNNQLSTIEALAYALEICCGISKEYYLQPFEAMQKIWLKHLDKNLT